MSDTPWKERLRRLLRSEVLQTAVPTAGLLLLAFGVAFWFVEPAPPRHLKLAAPDEAGARYYARKYQEILARDHVQLETVQATGSQGSLEMLAKGEVDVAMAQGGATAPQGEEDLKVLALGSLAYAPVWVLHRGEPVEELRNLAGRRISVGPEQSGTHALALALLSAAGADQPPTTLLRLTRDEALARLGKGEIDAAILVAPAEAPWLARAASNPELHLLSFARADAWVKKLRFLNKVVLPRGIFSLAKDVPDRDVVLLAPTLNLLANEDLHPALAYLLLRAATEVHASAGLLDGAGEFPAGRETGFELGAEARRYYKNGVPLLQRFLPFWLANFVDRMWVMLVPLVAILLPLGRAVPALYNWRVRRKVFTWYARLKEIELELDHANDAAALARMLERLEQAERAVHSSPTPISQAENLYSFRVHVDVVRRRIQRRLEPQAVRA